MKPSAIPLSVASRAARGVWRRSASATQAPENSMSPDPSVATRPACHATRAGSSAPAAAAASLAGSITRNTWANSETVLIP